MEITRSNFRSEITAKPARVIPMAKDPVLPTKILPPKFRTARKSHAAKGPYRRIAYGPDIIANPVKIIAGQIVSKPFNPPSWFTVLVIMVTSSGIIRK